MGSSARGLPLPHIPLKARVGFMQGRLSPPVDGRIQAFPWADWEREFPVAQGLGFARMEWTLDYPRALDNPIMTAAGRKRIATLAAAHGVRVEGLTGDLFMQRPFWKAQGEERQELITHLDLVLDACAAVGVGVIVVPLVDNASIQSEAQERALEEVFAARAERLIRDGLIIAFECDYAPQPLARLIERFPSTAFAITYDIGNSAAAGYAFSEELAAYGPRIGHVHIKDRVRGGGTVPLGSGSADIKGTLQRLEREGYGGLYTLQTARAADGDHAGVLARYRAMALAWLGAEG